MAEYGVDWFEELVVPEQLSAYRAVRAGQPIPVARGETWHTRYGMREPIETRAVDIIQHDICGVGGFTEAKRVADLAALHGVRVVPHVWGTAVQIAAALQFMAAMVPNPVRRDPIEPILEFDRTHNPFRRAVVTTGDQTAEVAHAVEGPCARPCWRSTAQAVKSLSAGQLAYGHSNGRLEDKAAFVESLDGKNALKSLDLSDQTVQIVGDTAIVRHTFDAVNNLPDGRTITAHIKLLQVWAREGGSWNLLARQSAPLPA